MTPDIEPFAGEGEVRALARSIDWAETPLGPVEGWSKTLRNLVRTSLDSPFPINLWCGDDLVLIYNDAYRHVLGAKHPAALGRSGTQVWAEIWDQIQPMFDRIRAGGPPVFQEDAPFVIRRALRPATEPGDPEYPADPGDPSLDAEGVEPNAWFTFSLSPVRDHRDEIVAFLNIVAESTRRVQIEKAHEVAREKAERAEARLREIFEHAPAFMALLRGPDHVFEYVNRAYYQLVGHRELLGRPAFDALPEVRGQGFEELLDQVRRTGEPFVGREIAFTVSPSPESEPEERFVDLVYYPFAEADGERSGVVAHGSDVTEHVLARREAQRARAEAERANMAKSQFLATMSHEIRTPINAVMGYADLLDAGVAGPLLRDQQQYVDGIQASSRHLLGLISGILDLAKIEAGELVVGSEEVRVREAVTAALRIVAPQADEKGLAIAESWECEEDIRVRGDEHRIRQILLNLLSNALKFSEEGGRITVRCRVRETAQADTVLPGVGPWVVLEVEDTGRGIGPGHLADVFEPFVQVETGHTRTAGGTGLGLTISRRLARLLAGELTVRSDVGMGSCFTLWLTPAVQEPSAAPREERAVAQAWPPDPHELPGLASVGRTLLSVLERAEQEWVERLQSDPDTPETERLNRAQIADQTAELIAAFAKVLFILEEGGGDAALLNDAEMVLKVIATRHGHQRRRLGWGRAPLQREYQILGELLDAELRREAPKRTAANLTTALAVVQRLVDRAAGISLDAYLGAAADADSNVPTDYG